MRTATVKTFSRQPQRIVPFKASAMPSEDSAAGATDIIIRIKNGVAVLTGQAGSREEKRQAAMAASRVAGVAQVYDLMLLDA